LLAVVSDRRQPGNALIVYALRTHPLRQSVADHLLAFRRYSRYRCFYLNIAARRVPRHMARMKFDLVVFDTTFLATRWSPATFARLRRKAAPLIGVGGRRVALPQDEFLHGDVLCEFIDEFGIDTVCSVAPESEWPSIYPSVDRERVSFQRVLTGYLDDATVARAQQIVACSPARHVDVGYRAWHSAPWLGRHGMLKRDIATAVAARAPATGLTVDLSTSDGDVLLEDHWLRFLARCRYTIGVEGGASVLDFDGSIRERTERYVAQHPDAPFEEIEDHCFRGEDGKVALVALSPRHLEACATKTCQILVEGSYNDVLRPGEHYIELRRDLSNLDAVLAQLGDEARRRSIVERAYRDVVASGRYSYAQFVREVESAGADAASAQGSDRRDAVRHQRNRAEEQLTWRRVAVEAKLARPAAALRAIASRG
jgi:hypothetical protein